MNEGYSGLDPTEDTESPPRHSAGSPRRAVTVGSIRQRILKDEGFLVRRDQVGVTVGSIRQRILKVSG